MRYFVMGFSLLLSGCASMAPIGGAILGGGVGSIAGPVGGAAGAGLGAAAGSIWAGDKELTQTKEELKALSTGDVAKMIELQAGREQSGFDQVIDGVYRVLWLLGIFGVLWVFVPIIYTRFLHKKIKANGTST
jgi:hypothetical protein